jgi:hypothetical protein
MLRSNQSDPSESTPPGSPPCKGHSWPHPQSGLAALDRRGPVPRWHHKLCGDNCLLSERSITQQCTTNTYRMSHPPGDTSCAYKAAALGSLMIRRT